MPNNLTKTRTVKKRLEITPEIRKAYEKSIRKFEADPNADPDARPLSPEKWAQSMSREEFLATRRAKKLTTVRLDVDVLEWLKSKGEGHISRVNSILRAVMLAENKR